MGFNTTFDVNGSGMKAQMQRIEVLSSNVANVNVTRSPEGGPYRRKDVIFQSIPFNQTLTQSMNNKNLNTGVEVSNVIEDKSPFLKKYEPNHPDAQKDGYVLYPNINIVAEMINIQEAAKAYEANVAVVNSVKSMVAKTLEISK